MGMTGKKHTEGTKKKISDSKKGKCGGKNHPMYGKHHTKESNRKNSESCKGRVSHMKGKKHTEETKNKISKSRKGKCKGKPTWNKGLTKETDERLKKISKILILSYKNGRVPYNKGKVGMRGKNSPSWLGGISFEPYGIEFNDDLKEVIRNRDRRKCQICEKTELENKERLSIHHIDYDKKNNNPNNLISLCRKCHVKTNYKRDYWIKYFIFYLDGGA